HALSCVLLGHCLAKKQVQCALTSGQTERERGTKRRVFVSIGSTRNVLASFGPLGFLGCFADLLCLWAGVHSGTAGSSWSLPHKVRWDSAHVSNNKNNSPVFPGCMSSLTGNILDPHPQRRDSSSLHLPQHR
ncbi:unnamed protein product, partial [Discosporangium mesarthrocarpum]